MITPRRRLYARFFLVGVLGTAAMAFFAIREVRSIREASRAYERDHDLDDTTQAPPGGTAPPQVVLAERQRAGPGTAGRYVLTVAGMRWELDTPAPDAGAAAWDAWEAASEPRWAALEEALTALAVEDPDVRAEVFAPWADEPDRTPEAFLVRLLSTLARAGVLNVDVATAHVTVGEHVRDGVR